jgi:hypothetical protein
MGDTAGVRGGVAGRLPTERLPLEDGRPTGDPDGGVMSTSSTSSDSGVGKDAAAGGWVAVDAVAQSWQD